MGVRSWKQKGLFAPASIACCCFRLTAWFVDETSHYSTRTWRKGSILEEVFLGSRTATFASNAICGGRSSGLIPHPSLRLTWLVDRQRSLSTPTSLPC